MKVRDILKRNILKSILLSKVNELKTAITNALGDVSGGLINDLKSDIPNLQNDVTQALDGFATDAGALIREEISITTGYDNPMMQDYETQTAKGVWSKIIDLSPIEVLKYNALTYQFTPQVETTLGTVANYLKIGNKNLALTGGAGVLGSMPNYTNSIKLGGAFQPSGSLTTGIIKGQCGRGNDFFLEPGNTYYIPKKISNTINLSSYRDIGMGLSVWAWLDTGGTGTPSLALMLLRAGA